MAEGTTRGHGKFLFIRRLQIDGGMEGGNYFLRAGENELRYHERVFVGVRVSRWRDCVSSSKTRPARSVCRLVDRQKQSVVRAQLRQPRLVVVFGTRHC